MLGYAERARRPRARPHRRRAAHRRPRPAHARRPVRGRRPAQPVREAVRPADRPRARSRRCSTQRGCTVCCAGDDERSWSRSRVATTTPEDAACARRAGERGSAPQRAVTRASRWRRSRGSPTASPTTRRCCAGRREARSRDPATATRRRDARGRPTRRPRPLYAELLDGRTSPDSTFVSLGGDSLSYVEMSVAARGAARSACRRLAHDAACATSDRASADGAVGAVPRSRRASCCARSRSCSSSARTRSCST